jgi:hypothetical protein
MSVSGHKGQYGSSLHERQRRRRLGHPRTTDDLTKERGSSQDPQMVMRSLNRSESCTRTDTRIKAIDRATCFRRSRVVVSATTDQVPGGELFRDVMDLGTRQGGARSSTCGRSLPTPRLPHQSCCSLQAERITEERARMARRSGPRPGARAPPSCSKLVPVRQMPTPQRRRSWSRQASICAGAWLYVCLPVRVCA